MAAEMQRKPVSEEGRHSPTETAARQGSAGLRVLLVEAEANAAARMAGFLRQYGHQVQVVSNGPSALQADQVGPPDVVLLDVGLPGGGGWELAKQLGRQGTEKRPFLIALNGQWTEADRLRSQEAGIDLVLPKLVNPELLRGLLHRFQTIITPGDQIPPRNTEDDLEAGIQEESERRLRSNPYLALKSISCEYHYGVLLLRGCLPTYYLKQVAQAVVAGIEGVVRVDNQIQVGARISGQG
jgi:CheY-like chemotaxis protein